MRSEFFDVVIVGAGLSGVGAAYHLQDKCPQKSYVILEGRQSIGGTWDLFRYPGIRSDSDMYTLGYNFKPWLESKAIADGPSILKYVKETAAENGIEKNIRFGHKVVNAAWTSSDALWRIEAQCKESGEAVVIRCNSILMCSGYYSYEGGHTPEFKGRERFAGKIIHPQQWPDDLDYRDKRVVVIGSGATAVTLIPEMAGESKGIVMLQRSPTYMVSAPDEDWIAKLLQKIFSQKNAYSITRWKNIKFQQFIYWRSRTAPEKVKKKLLKLLRNDVGPDCDIEKHFTPHYDPWDQRLCLVPNSNFFEAIRSGNASIVTDHIDSFTEKGILLKSGEELEADIIVTATGLDLVLLGGADFTVDGEPVDVSKTFSYKGMMFSDVPNLVSTFGYINASWTLRADLTAEYFCMLLNHMDEMGYRQCAPRLGDKEKDMPARDWITVFSSGYMQRAMHMLPKQGDRGPWINTQNYSADKKMIHGQPIDDGVLSFGNPEQGSVKPGFDQIESDAA